MICHIGDGKLILSRDVAAIFDLDGKVTTQITSDFLKQADREGKTEFPGEDIPRSFVLTRDKKGRESVVLSRLSPAALTKRIDSVTPETF